MVESLVTDGDGVGGLDSWFQEVLYHVMDVTERGGLYAPSHKVGDYVHCVARILNILFKRLLAELTTIRKAGPLKTFLTKLTMQAQGVPLPERLAPNVGWR